MPKHAARRPVSFPYALAAKAAAPYVHPKFASIENKYDMADPLKALFAKISGTSFRPVGDGT